MKLGIWHRLGVVLSFAWVAAASALLVSPRLIHTLEAANSARTLCFSARGQAARTLRENSPVTGSRGRLTPSEFNELKELTIEARRGALQQINRNCDREYYMERQHALHELWGSLLAKVALPIMLAWLLVYLAIWAVRWILAADAA